MANEEHLEILKQGVKAWNRWREENPEIKPDLLQVNLRGEDLRDVNFSNTGLTMATLSWTLLSGANFNNASLFMADLCMADLTNAQLRSAFLWVTNLCYANLSGANLENAKFSQTLLGGTNFSGVVGLGSCTHDGPSIIDIETVAKSGKLPLSFLRGCGLPDAVIENSPILFGNSRQLHTCFISYSSKDHAFAETLHTDLQDRGIRCWFAPEDLKIGEEIRVKIDESIRKHDKLLLILSETSVRSQWVQQEVETALAKEREQGRTVLFPVRLDDAILELNSGWPALIKNTRHIGNFSAWKDQSKYRKAFERLIRDLQVEGEI